MYKNPHYHDDHVHVENYHPCMRTIVTQQEPRTQIYESDDDDMIEYDKSGDKSGYNQIHNMIIEAPQY